MTFVKGQSGNPGGKRPEKMWREAIVRAVKRREAGEGGPILERLADKMLDAALTGDLTALKEFGDRLDGKPAQQQIITGDDEGGPVQVETIKRIIVDPKKD